jgi:hypothetical protein
VANRNCPQKHIWRCRIVLLTADRLGRRRSCDSPWCGGSPERFIGRPAIPASPPPDEAGTFHQEVVQGWGQVQISPGLSLQLDEKRGSRHLLLDKTRPPLDQPVIDRVLALTSTDPPGETTHRTGRPWPRRLASSSARCSASAAPTGWSLIRVRQFKLSSDKAFAEKLWKIVGLYVDPSRGGASSIPVPYCREGGRGSLLMAITNPCPRARSIIGERKGVRPGVLASRRQPLSSSAEK